MPDNIKSLKKENDELKIQLEDLREEFKKFQQSTIAKISGNGTQLSSSPDPETLKGLEFLSDGYDDLKSFRDHAMGQMDRLNNRLDSIEKQICRLSDAIEEAQRYIIISII